MNNTRPGADQRIIRSLAKVDKKLAQTIEDAIHKLTKVTSVLSKEKEAITEVIDMAPYALSNLALAGDTKAHTLDTKDESGQPFANPTAPNGVLCQLFKSVSSAFCQSGASPAFGHPSGLSGLLGVGR